MHPHENPITRQLLRSFMQLDKIEWHQRSIEGYKPSEIKVLMCIKRGIKCHGPEMKVSEISKFLNVTSPTITQLLKGLEADGLVERRIDLTDRRAVGIKLTEKGEQVAQNAAEAFFHSLNGLVEYLGSERSEQLADLLTSVFTYFHERGAAQHLSHWNRDDEA